MDVSRILFTKETKEKLNKPLTVTEKGKLRWQKVKDAEASGKISNIHNRYELGYLAGYDKPNTGYSWASNMIQRGHISETFLGIDASHRATYEYHVIGEPDFDRKHARNGRNSKTKEKMVIVKQQIHKNLREKGKELFNKLQTASDDGTLAKYRTRSEIVKNLGCTRSWINGMITRGYVNEEIYGKDGNGWYQYKYSLTDKKPNYDYKKTDDEIVKVW